MFVPLSLAEGCPPVFVDTDPYRLELAFYSAAKMAGGLRDVDGCYQLTRALVGLRPDNALYHHLYSQILMQIGKREEAHEHILCKYELDPTNGLYVADAAIVYYRRGDLKKARALFKLSVELEPENAVSHFNYASFLHRLWSEDQDIELLKEVLRHLRIARDLDDCRVDEHFQEQLSDALTRVEGLLDRLENPPQLKLSGTEAAVPTCENDHS